MGILIDSERNIPSHVQDPKRYYRQDKPFFCKDCKQTNTMLENAWIRKDRITYFLNCAECGSISTVNVREKEIFRQMVNLEYIDNKESYLFEMFQVVFFYRLYSDMESSLEGLEMVKRLNDKFKHRKLWYKLRYLGRKTK